MNEMNEMSEMSEMNRLAGETSAERSGVYQRRPHFRGYQWWILGRQEHFCAAALRSKAETGRTAPRQKIPPLYRP
ncbi:MAG: hypothetical protein WCF18_25670 [Chthoniobacteraceae bacterium]